MPNPTRAQILNAHDALEKLCARLPATRAAKESILKALPPRPQPTMAEIEWLDGVHYLAEAEQEFYGNVIMLGLVNDGFIRFFIPNSSEQHFTVANPKTLTPTGRRYTLTEVQE